MPDQVFGQQSVGTQQHEYNEIAFVFKQLLNKVRFADLVLVKSVTNAGGVAPVGFVSIQILTNQMTGNRQSVPHGEIFNVPYLRVQGGSNAVIIDPEVGDIGLAVFASRDISSVKAAKGLANPGSFRGPGNPADGLYFGGFLNGTPTQYVRFSSAGMELVSPTKVTIRAPLVEIDATTSLKVDSPTTHATGALTVDAGATIAAGLTVTGGATIDGHDFDTHDHTPGTYVAGATPVTGHSGPVV